MEELSKQVRRAQWFLGVERFIGVLGWCCFGTLAAALALMVADKFWPTGVEDWLWAAGAVGLGVVLAVVWAVAAGRGRIDAAIEIDRRFALKERVSSALAMADDQRKTEAGQALLADAVRRVERIDVGEHFKASPGRQLLLPLVPALLALLVVVFWPAADTDPSRAGAGEADREQVKKSSESLRKKLVEKRDQAKAEGLKDAQELFERLEQGTEEISVAADADRKKALVKLNNLAREIEQRRKSLGGAENIQKQLDKLKNSGKGPDNKLIAAISRGDFKNAIEQLKQLREDLAKGTLTDEQKQDVARQMDEMKKKLEELVDAHREAVKDLEKRVDQARKEGRHADADKMQEQLNKLRQQLPQMDQLQDLADKLGQCSQCIQDNNLQDAKEMFDQLEGDLNDLKNQLQELEMLQEAMDQLAECRNEMNDMECPMCGGVGCPDCQGGMGMGEGQGAGPRPEEETDVNFRNTNTPQKVGPGAGVVVGEASGPNIKGEVGQEIKDQFQSTRVEQSDPLTGQRMPKKHRQHATEYFNRFREGGD